MTAHILKNVELEAIELRTSAATAGPWTHTEAPEPDSMGCLESVTSPASDFPVIGTTWYDGPQLVLRAPDGEFIAAAREDVPSLLLTLKAFRSELARMADAMRAIYAANEGYHVGLVRALSSKAVANYEENKKAHEAV